MTVSKFEFRPAEDHAWIAQAACAADGVAPMYPDEQDHAAIAGAKSICRGCPVRSQCLEQALNTGENFGVWGGLTADERRLVRRSEALRVRRERRSR